MSSRPVPPNDAKPKNKNVSFYKQRNRSNIGKGDGVKMGKGEKKVLFVK